MSSRLRKPYCLLGPWPHCPYMYLEGPPPSPKLLIPSCPITKWIVPFVPCYHLLCRRSRQAHQDRVEVEPQLVRLETLELRHAKKGSKSLWHVTVAGRESQR